MSSLHTSPEWSLLIYRVRDDAHQQKILRAFHRLATPGITVLGTQDGTDHFVIVDCETSPLEQHSRKTIVRLDPAATRVLRSRLVRSVAAD
jgi:hypothetical protein